MELCMIMCKGVTTKCTPKSGEARDVRDNDEIVCSIWRHIAGVITGKSLTNSFEHKATMKSKVTK